MMVGATSTLATTGQKTMAGNKKAAEVSASVYKALTKPAHPGQVRIMTWRVAVPPDGPEDKLWVGRCDNYWRTQERTYGLRMGAFSYTYDPEEMILTTASYVVEVLPGERITT